MGATLKALEAYRILKKAKKIKTYGTLVKQAIQEETRPGAVMKLGVRGMLEIAGKALGTPLTSHPYFKLHKTHLELLGQALNASSGHGKAREALGQAIRSADSAAARTAQLGQYQARKMSLKVGYATFVAGSLDLLRDLRRDPLAARSIREAGHTPESLRAWADDAVHQWRALWCELYLDSVQLLAMAEVEARATEAAMERFESQMKTLSSGGSLGRIFAHAVERDRQWEQFDRMTDPGAGDERAVEDPAGYARRQVASIEAVSTPLGEICEIVMGDDAYSTSTMAMKLKHH